MKNYFYFICIFLLGQPLWGQVNYEWAFETHQFDRVNDFNVGLAIVQKGKERGFIDTSGQIFIPPQFNIIDAFSEDVASAGFTDYVKMESRSGFIDR
ncbi:MAG: WG repeat-containing protein, partial [Bacteroidota bacterium]